MDIILLLVGFVLAATKIPLRVSHSRVLVPPHSSEVGGLFIVGYLGVKYLPLVYPMSPLQNAWLSSLLPLAALGVVLLFATPNSAQLSLVGVRMRTRAESIVHMLGWGLITAVFFAALIGALMINASPVGPDGIPYFLFSGTGGMPAL